MCFSKTFFFLKLRPPQSLPHSQSISTLCVLSALSRRCSVMGVIFIPVSPWLWPLDGWIFTFFTHWWPFPVATQGAPVSLPRGLLTDYCLQISYGHRELYTGSQGHGAQRLEKGERRRERYTVRIPGRLSALCLQMAWRDRGAEVLSASANIWVVLKWCYYIYCYAILIVDSCQ